MATRSPAGPRTHIHLSKCLLSSEERDWLCDPAGPQRRDEYTRLCRAPVTERVRLFWVLVFSFSSELSAVLICPRDLERQALCSKGFMQKQLQVWSFNFLSLKKRKKDPVTFWTSWQNFVLKSRIVASSYFMLCTAGHTMVLCPLSRWFRHTALSTPLSDLWSLKTLSQGDKSFSSIRDQGDRQMARRKARWGLSSLSASKDLESPGVRPFGNSQPGMPWEGNCRQKAGSSLQS